MKLTEKMIRERANANSFSKGEAYYRSGAILNTVKRGSTLEGFCEGSEALPYRVQVMLANEAIAFATCTCPYSFDGDCKHIVALLLTHLNTPQQFAERLPLEEALQERSKEELAVLIVKMIDKYPDLQHLVDRPVPGKRKTDLDLASFRREMDYALRHYGGWGDTTAVYAVGSIASTAADFAAQGDLHNASRIYRVIVEELLETHDYPGDDEGEFTYAFNEVLEDLARCLDDPTLAEDSGERQAILNALLDSYIWDVNEGGYGIAEEAPTLMMKYIRPEDVLDIRVRIEAAQKRKSQSAYPEWGVRAYAGLLMELDALDNTSPEVTLQRLRDQGLYGLLFNKLLSLQRTDEAIQVVEEHLPAPHERLNAVQQLANDGHTETAIRLAEAGMGQEIDNWLTPWLLQMYRATGRDEACFELELRQMMASPYVKNYQSLAEVGEKIGKWETTRQEVFAQLEKEGKLGELTRLYLHEQDWDAAWDTLERLQADPQPMRIWWGGSLEMEVARASKEDRPQRALPVYLKAARQQISQRNRKHYAEAAQLLRVGQDFIFGSMMILSGSRPFPVFVRSFVIYQHFKMS